MEPEQAFAASAGSEDAIALFDRLMREPKPDQVPSVLKPTLANRPDIYSAVMAAGKPILFEGLLPGSVKHLVVMLIAHRRGCRFCVTVHKAMLEHLDIDAALVENCLEDADMKLLPPTFRLILKFALQAAENPSTVDDAQFGLLRDGGLGEEEILEVAMLAAFANFLVTWADVPALVDD